MYTIKCNGNLIYDPRLDELGMISAVLIKENNISDNFTFKPSLTNINAQNLPKLTSFIEVFDDGVRVFRGRILNSEQDINNIFEYVCEGELAFLSDSIIRPYEWGGDNSTLIGGVQAYLQFLIDNHNSQVDIDRQFTLRKVTVTDPNDYIVRASAQYPTTQEEMKLKLIDLLGGHFFLERIGNLTYLDYLEDSPYLSNQTIRLGENIIDLKHFVKSEELATAVIPLGHQLTNEQGVDLGRLTIKDVNGGVDYLYDQAAVDEYGYIFKTVVYDDITIAANLKVRGQQELAYAINPIASIEINCVDLAHMGVDVDNIRFLDYVKVESKPNGIEGTLLVTRMISDLLNPANNTITIGSDFGSFTAGKAGLEQRINIVEGNAATKQNISNINNNIINIWSSITQSEYDIMSQVNAQFITRDEHGLDITDLSTTLQQTNDTFEFTFDKLNQTITEVNNDLQTQFNEQSKYIRFEEGNIILGVAGSELILKQQNDRISFIQSGVEVAYFSNKKLYVTDGEFLNSLTLGYFGYIPRANGNLSFRKVK